jgi:hypothetical protein
MIFELKYFGKFKVIIYNVFKVCVRDEVGGTSD